MTVFNLVALFYAVISQSEVNWKLSSASDWIMTAQENANELKVVTLLGSLL